MSLFDPHNAGYDDIFDFLLASPTLDKSTASLCCVEAKFVNKGLQSPDNASRDTVSSPVPSIRDLMSISNELPVASESKRYRTCKRQELETLRDTITTLEVRLAALKARPAQGLALVVQQPIARVWEQRAARESERRQAAERENEELLEVVEMHTKLAQKLDHVMRKVATHVNSYGPY